MSALFLSFFVNLLVGPSEVFGLPDSLLIMAIGQALSGLLDPIILVPTLPEMIDSASDKYPGMELKINDMSAATFNSFLGIG
mmetsp:Transcript_44521/g.32628  ORF Transcript_44521/g.32628 Transcript_44521/m.32628 type:complete len:82 (+) Transcript_44521:923-1168(+)